jgi:transcriptional regulator with GAF, ATPase, and Fis domain
MPDRGSETRTHPGFGVRPFKRVVVRVIDGPSAGAVVELKGHTSSIGAALGNELSRTDAGIAISDLGSRNGTYLRDARIDRGVVQPGARLKLGASTIEIHDGSMESISAEDATLSAPGLVGSSEAHRRLLKDVKQLARSSCSVLIHGETGAGKEVVARAIHELSARKQAAFTVIDCGSIPEHLIASELFGHEKGAFTGAEKRRLGAFEAANGGTVFLDEVGELPLHLQPALLGVLERRRFRRVGGTEEVSVDVRAVSATHRDLRSDVNEGRFREDLYYRIAVGRITVPPLRERSEDIGPLIRHFAQEITGDDQD